MRKHFGTFEKRAPYGDEINRLKGKFADQSIKSLLLFIRQVVQGAKRCRKVATKRVCSALYKNCTNRDSQKLGKTRFIESAFSWEMFQLFLCNAQCSTERSRFKQRFSVRQSFFHLISFCNVHDIDLKGHHAMYFLFS